MNVSDVVALPIKAGAAIRHRRAFHPVGVLAGGSIERMAPPGVGLPIASSDVTARVSKGAGLPGGLPDVAGLAWRMPAEAFAPTPWDVLLASAVPGRWGRFALCPALSWSGVTLSSLMPLRYRDQNWWVAARLVTDVDGLGLSLQHIEKQIAATGIEFDITQACGLGEFQPLARLSLRRLAGPDEHDVAFDPTTHTARGVRLGPHWLTALRADAYERSREGRE